MAQSGLHAYLAFKLASKTPQKKWFLFAFILGSMIPDLDIIITLIYSFFSSIENSILLTHRTFSHSIFTYIFIYLLFLIIYEITKNKKYLFLGNGLIFGFCIHLILDIFFWFDSVHLFWPLPIEKLNIWRLSVNDNIQKIILLSEFLFFRLFAFKIIETVVTHTHQNSKYLKHLTSYMKVQLIFMLIFGICSYFLKINLIYSLFWALYTPSLIIIILLLFKTRKSFNDYMIHKEIITHKSAQKRTSIHNIE